ncbi:hypothetical protein LP419_23540 [Massilia sp. H-1]|nr:hypothetical protein LP419_23540 [Massilia sp. H-1]
MQGKVDLMGKVFLGRLPVRFEKMNEAFAQCRAGTADPQAGLTELHRLLHSLAGAGPAPSVSRAWASRPERLNCASAQLLAGGQHSDAELDQLGQALTTLQEKN